MFSYFVLTAILSGGTFDPTQLCGDLILRFPQNQYRTEYGYITMGDNRSQDTYTETGGIMPVEVRDCGPKLKWHKVWLKNPELDRYTAIPAGITEREK